LRLYRETAAGLKATINEAFAIDGPAIVDAVPVSNELPNIAQAKGKEAILSPNRRLTQLSVRLVPFSPVDPRRRPASYRHDCPAAGRSAKSYMLSSAQLTENAPQHLAQLAACN
jgi:hypothetical protein